MAGGMDHGRPGRRRTLAERTAAGDDATDAHATGRVPDDDAGRPCWVGVAGATVPGVVHAWRRDATSGRWEALVVAWVPAPAVRPR